MIIIYHGTSWHVDVSLSCLYPSARQSSLSHTTKMEPLSTSLIIINQCSARLHIASLFSKILGFWFTTQKGKQVTFLFTKKKFYTRMSRWRFPIRFWSKSRDLTKIRWWFIPKIPFTPPFFYGIHQNPFTKRSFPLIILGVGTMVYINYEVNLHQQYQYIENKKKTF